MNIQVREVSGKAELKQFIYLPAKIHRNHSSWVPPIYMDDWEYFNSEKNKSFAYSDTILLLAWKDQHPVGRIMGIIVRPYNELHKEKHVRFSWIETENDWEVFTALIQAVEEWGREKGMTHIVGPLGFSDKDPQGFLYEGFDEPVEIASNCNFPFMLELTEKYGFTPKENLVVYKVPVPEVSPPIFARIAERYATRETDLKVIEFTSRRKVKPYIHRALGLVNQTFTEIYGFFPYTEKEMDDFANRFLYLINPRYIKIIINGKEEAVAFIVGMSDISRGIQKAKGKLVPFGWIHLVRASKRTKQLNLLLGAVRPDYQGRGLDVLMGGKLLESARATGKTMLDSHLELEQNTKVRAEMERMRGKVYKRFRIYIKSLARPNPSEPARADVS
jgi:GNAT superfamily N-acetyltransferase